MRRLSSILKVSSMNSDNSPLQDSTNTRAIQAPVNQNSHPEFLDLGCDSDEIQFEVENVAKKEKRARLSKRVSFSRCREVKEFAPGGSTITTWNSTYEEYPKHHHSNSSGSDVSKNCNATSEVEMNNDTGSYAAMTCEEIDDIQNKTVAMEMSLINDSEDEKGLTGEVSRNIPVDSHKTDVNVTYTMDVTSCETEVYEIVNEVGVVKDNSQHIEIHEKQVIVNICESDEDTKKINSHHHSESDEVVNSNSKELSQETEKDDMMEITNAVSNRTLDMLKTKTGKDKGSCKGDEMEITRPISKAILQSRMKHHDLEDELGMKLTKVINTSEHQKLDHSQIKLNKPCMEVYEKDVDEMELTKAHAWNSKIQTETNDILPNVDMELTTEVTKQMLKLLSKENVKSNENFGDADMELTKAIPGMNRNAKQKDSSKHETDMELTKAVTKQMLKLLSKENENFEDANMELTKAIPGMNRNDKENDSSKKLKLSKIGEKERNHMKNIEDNDMELTKAVPSLKPSKSVFNRGSDIETNNTRVNESEMKDATHIHPSASMDPSRYLDSPLPPPSFKNCSMLTSTVVEHNASSIFEPTPVKGGGGGILKNINQHKGRDDVNEARHMSFFDISASEMKDSSFLTDKHGHPNEGKCQQNAVNLSSSSLVAMSGWMQMEGGRQSEKHSPEMTKSVSTLYKERLLSGECGGKRIASAINEGDVNDENLNNLLTEFQEIGDSLSRQFNEVDEKCLRECEEVTEYIIRVDKEMRESVRLREDEVEEFNECESDDHLIKELSEKVDSFCVNKVKNVGTKSHAWTECEKIPYHHQLLHEKSASSTSWKIISTHCKPSELHLSFLKQVLTLQLQLGSEYSKHGVLHFPIYSCKMMAPTNYDRTICYPWPLQHVHFIQKVIVNGFVPSLDKNKLTSSCTSTHDLEQLICEQILPRMKEIELFLDTLRDLSSTHLDVMGGDDDQSFKTSFWVNQCLEFAAPLEFCICFNVRQLFLRMLSISEVECVNKRLEDGVKIEMVGSSDRHTTKHLNSLLFDKVIPNLPKCDVVWKFITTLIHSVDHLIDTDAQVFFK